MRFNEGWNISFATLGVKLVCHEHFETALSMRGVIGRSTLLWDGAAIDLEHNNSSLARYGRSWHRSGRRDFRQAAFGRT